MAVGRQLNLNFNGSYNAAACTITWQLWAVVGSCAAVNQSPLPVVKSTQQQEHLNIFTCMLHRSCKVADHVRMVIADQQDGHTPRQLRPTQPNSAQLSSPHQSAQHLEPAQES
jgi:hypothetical protein